MSDRDPRSETLLDRLAGLVAVPSISRAEDALAARVAHELTAAGLHVRRELNNVWCEVGDAPRPRLLLNSHLDTVPPGNGWTGDPWTPRRDGDRLIGLGANDAKGCVTAMIAAVLAIHDRLRAGAALGGTLVLALTAEEEISGKGLSHVLDALRPIDAALVGEPTGLTPMIAQRGLLILRCVARGRGGHPANTPPDTADNAVINAARAMLRLAELDFGPPHPLLGRCHAHVTTVSGGTALNVIPDACEFFIDIRTTPNQPHRELADRLARLLPCEVHVRSERLAPVQTPADAAIARACVACTGRAAAGSPTMSDMVFLSDVPCVKIGPGESARSHTPDEFVSGRELVEGAAVYEAIARHYLRKGAGPHA